jgi:hypothetical protein
MPDMLAPAGERFCKRRILVSTILNVPFAEKDQAKSLGARWDAVRRKWYVEDGALLTPFQRWLPEMELSEHSDGHLKTKGQETANSPPKAKPPNMKSNTSDTQVNSLEGRLSVGPLYVDLGHDCIPWEPCKQCTDTLAIHREAQSRKLADLK